jgi:hypothetical protein
MCPDWVKDGENGLMLEGSPQKIGEQIVSLVEGGGLRYACLAEGALRMAPTVPDWTGIMEQWFDLYHEAIGIARARSPQS